MVPMESILGVGRAPSSTSGGPSSLPDPEMSAFTDGTDHRGGHSRVTQFRNQEDTGGHARSRQRRQSSTGGHLRSRGDTEGHVTAPVRDREAPGSNPGPPTNF